MADTTPKRQKLNDAQKAETRAVVDAYKADHPQATLKEIQASLTLPYKDLITEGVLRGLAARPGAARGKGARGAAAGAPRAGRGARAGAARGKTTRGRALEKVIGDLNGLRKRRDDLDAQIADLEAEIRGRMHHQLGLEHAGRIFGHALQGLGDTAQRVTSTVGDKMGEVAGRVTGREG
ncbi:MAG TPA: hypothetical protein VKY74_15130 [Chloroflexia bacterium]|nr:hypothetical protein [Chloroflexia bacterium]